MLVMSCVGNPISILDGIFVTIKDDIDCLPHPTKGEYFIRIFYLKYLQIQQTCHMIFFIIGGTTWLHENRSVEKDSAVVSRLRSCGAILLGKANMHELGMGTTGNNSNYG